MKTIVKAQYNDQMLCFDSRSVALSKGVLMELIIVPTVDLGPKIYNKPLFGQIFSFSYAK
jgi:hypothetical protein